jgi:hypothetical protein
VELAAVDEPSRRHLTDLGAVLPAVPQPPDDLAIVGGLVEQFGAQLLNRRVGAVPEVQPRHTAAAEVRGLVRAGRHPDLDPRRGRR